MTENQIRLRTLLHDDVMYKKWFVKVPTLKVVHCTPPWRLFIQKEKDGRWGKIDIPSYPKALAAVKLKLPEVWDMAVHCKPQACKPPVLKVAGKRVWMPMPDDHRWCVYCRRPTLFLYFNKHPNLKFINPEEERCLICGARSLNMREFQSPVPWPAALSMR
jgi:hypothetical protein